MFCHNCGTRIAENSARYCPSCGTELSTGENRKKAEMEMQAVRPGTEHRLKNEESAGVSALNKTNRFKESKSLFWPIAVPLISLAVTASSGAAYYYNEIHTNQQVQSLKETAEKEALKGKYNEAMSALQKADRLRPSYKVLAADQKQIQAAVQDEKSLNSITDLLKSQQLDKAESEINTIKGSLKIQQGPLFTAFQKQIDEKTTTLAVAKIKTDINNISSVDQLADKLSALSSLNSAETEEVKNLILAKIIDLSTKDAETQLDKKEFTAASSIIDKGLQYASSETKLVSFKDRIQKEQTAFEKAEQQRIEQAMEAAAQEDLANHTTAVSVADLNATTDEFGDVHITGTIKNTATVPISSIQVYYTVLDLSGNVIGSDFVYVTPYSLDSGENANFATTYYGANQNAKVQITKVTWQLN